MSDQSRWELREVLGCPFLRVLAPKGAEKTFLDKFAEKRQNREVAVYVAKTLQQVVRDGIARSLTVGRIKRLKGNIVEVKAQGTVIRLSLIHISAGVLRAHPRAVRQGGRGLRRLLHLRVREVLPLRYRASRVARMGAHRASVLRLRARSVSYTHLIEVRRHPHRVQVGASRACYAHRRHRGAIRRCGLPRSAEEAGVSRIVI